MATNSALQGLIVAPRNYDGTARVHVTKRTIGEQDSKFYQLDSHTHREDFLKYKVLSDEQLIEEFKRSQEVKQSMISLNTKQKTMSTKLKIVPPRFDVGVKSTSKVEKKNVEIRQNLKPPDGVAQYFDDEHVKVAIYTMKNKYEENIDVIEKLFSEKMTMENRLRNLEDELLKSKGFVSMSSVDSPLGQQQHQNLSPPSYDKNFRDSPMSASDAAGLFSGLHSRSVDNVTTSSRKPRATSASSLRGRSLTDDDFRRRSMSSSRSLTGREMKFHVTANLQADMDRS